MASAEWNRENHEHAAVLHLAAITLIPIGISLYIRMIFRPLNCIYAGISPDQPSPTYKKPKPLSTTPTLAPYLRSGLIPIRDGPKQLRFYLDIYNRAFVNHRHPTTGDWLPVVGCKVDAYLHMYLLWPIDIPGARRGPLGQQGLIWQAMEP
jgi:hypothetical protein